MKNPKVYYIYEDPKTKVATLSLSPFQNHLKGQDVAYVEKSYVEELENQIKEYETLTGVSSVERGPTSPWHNIKIDMLLEVYDKLDEIKQVLEKIR